jgi:hypothetical protein
MPLPLKVYLYDIALLEGYFAQIPTIQRQLERVALQVVQCEIDIHPTDTRFHVATHISLLLTYVDVQLLGCLLAVHIQVTM